MRISRIFARPSTGVPGVRPRAGLLRVEVLEVREVAANPAAAAGPRSRRGHGGLGHLPENIRSVTLKKPMES